MKCGNLGKYDIGKSTVGVRNQEAGLWFGSVFTACYNSMAVFTATVLSNMLYRN